MLKNLKTLKGVQTISKKKQQSILGGNSYLECLRTCGGSCSITGRCFWMEK
ncbi:hypothetical protein IMCC3317_08950 [Kordia antarctica]|uniref:Uncharacterized protein n=1 Tax=Kordia antarctica TaxID=1218801 RepID=A0A7L4ZGJ7_9FLAO|nr:hypothetical protein IMCC3317_08950 [Kordia antarctica]